MRNPVIREIDVQQLADRLARGEPTRLIDVRQPWEHDLAALSGSQLIPLDQLARRAGEIQPADGDVLVVYCHHGIRSRSGAALLQQLAFADVASLAGGIDAWSLHIAPAMPRY